jgi:hypothetical protein
LARPARCPRQRLGQLDRLRTLKHQRNKLGNFIGEDAAEENSRQKGLVKGFKKICPGRSQKACDEIRQKNEISSRTEGCCKEDR